MGDETIYKHGYPIGLVTVILAAVAKNNWAIDDSDKKFLDLIIAIGAIDIPLPFLYPVPVFGTLLAIAQIVICIIVLTTKHSKSKWDRLRTYNNRKNKSFTDALFAFVIINLIGGIVYLLGSVGYSIYFYGIYDKAVRAARQAQMQQGNPFLGRARVVRVARSPSQSQSYL
jgi:hypothetical protein